MNKTKLLILITSLLFTIAMCYFLLQYVSIQYLLIGLRKVEFKIILIAFIVHLFTYLSRSIIIKLLLSDTKIKLREVFVAHLIQNFFVRIVPASLGEFSFPVLTKKWVPMSRSLSSILVTKLLLLCGMLILLFVSIFYVEIEFIEIDTSNYLAILIGLIIFVILLIKIPFFKRLAKKIRIGKSSIYDYINHFINSIRLDLFKLRQTKYLIPIILLVLFTNLALAFFYLLLLNSIDINLDIWDCLFLSSIAIAILILPIRSFGGFGTSEGAWALGMIILGYNEEVGIQSGFVIHIVVLINVTLLFLMGIVLRIFLR